MATYKVKIIETLSKVIDVDVSDMDEAWEIANYMYKDCQVVLTADDLDEREIYVLGNERNKDK